MNAEQIFIKNLEQAAQRALLVSQDMDADKACAYLHNSISQWMNAARDLTVERKTITIECADGAVKVSGPYFFNPGHLSVDGYGLLTIQQSEELIMAIRAMQNEVKQQS